MAAHGSAEQVRKHPNFSATPIFALSTVAISLLCTVACIVVLEISDGQQTESWRVKPTVLLAIFSTVANSGLAFLLSEGVTVAWWRQFHHGASASELHRTWSVGYNLQSAIRSLFRLDRIVLGTILAFAMLLDGPLLQRASSVESRAVISPVRLNLSIPEQLPLGFTGSQAPGATTINANPEFLIALQRNQLQRNKINSTLALDSGCQGICQGTVRAAGVVPDCTSVNYNYDFTNSTVADPGLAFSIAYTRDLSPSLILSVVSTKMRSGCFGSVLSRNCTLRSATINYPITIQNNSITIRPIELREPKYYDGGDSNNTLGAGSGALGGVGVMLEAFYLSNATIYQDDTGDPSVPYITYENGAQALEYMDLSPIDLQTTGNSSYNSSDPLLCQYSSWNDPTDDILNAIDHLMFRTALLVSETRDTSLTALSGSTDYPPVPYAQPFTASQQSTQLSFRTDHTYLIITAVLMFICTFGVAMTLWGWWELGRPVSMSPFEIAKAFNAPGFEDVKANASAEEIVKVLGSMKVIYGETAFGREHKSSIGLQVLPKLE